MRMSALVMYQSRQVELKEASLEIFQYGVKWQQGIQSFSLKAEN